MKFSIILISSEPNSRLSTSVIDPDERLLLSTQKERKSRYKRSKVQSVNRRVKKYESPAKIKLNPFVSAREAENKLDTSFPIINKFNVDLVKKEGR